MNSPETSHIDFSISLESAAPKVPANNVDTTDLDEILTSPDEMADAEDVDRKTVITNFVIEHDHFGLDTTQANITEWLVEMLTTIEEAKQQFLPGFDITSVDPEVLRPMVQQWRANYEELAIKTENLRREELLQAYMIAYAGRSTSEIFEALSNKQEIPEPTQLKAAAYAQALSSDVVKNKSDRAVIAALINQYTLTNAPAPYWFVLSEIMQNDDLSEKTKTAIAKEFSLDPQIISGATLMRVLEDVTDDEQGNVPGEAKIVIVGDGLEVATNESGEQIIKVETDDGILKLPIPPETDSLVLGLKLSLLKIWRANPTETFFGEDISPSGSLIRDANGEDINRVRKIFEAMLGGNDQYRGEILTDDLVESLTQLNVFVHNGHNADELGLYDGDTNYAVNLERLAAMSSYLRSQPKIDNVHIGVLTDHLALICLKESAR